MVRFNRPYGKNALLMAVPALKRRATVEGPYGTAYPRGWAEAVQQLARIGFAFTANEAKSISSSRRLSGSGDLRGNSNGVPGSLQPLRSGGLGRFRCWRIR